MAKMGSARNRWTEQDKDLVERVFGVHVNVRRLTAAKITKAVNFKPHLEDLPDLLTDLADVEPLVEVKSGKENLEGTFMGVESSRAELRLQLSSEDQEDNEEDKEKEHEEEEEEDEEQEDQEMPLEQEKVSVGGWHPFETLSTPPMVNSPT
jgi:hypothetical protein